MEELPAETGDWAIYIGGELRICGVLLHSITCDSCTMSVNHG